MAEPGSAGGGGTGAGPRRAGAARRGRLAVGGVALLVLVALGAFVTRAGSGPGDPQQGDPHQGARQEHAGPFPEPEPGEAVAVWVGQAPVLVVKDRAGQVHAVEAARPGAPPGADVAVAWCAAGQVHVSMRSGGTFAPDGRYLDGPAPGGLATYDVEVGPDGVRVGDRRDPLPRGAGDSPPATEPAALPSGPVFAASCLDEHLEPDHLVLHGWPPERVTTPEEAAARGDAERVLVEGRLSVGGESARLCGGARPGHRPPPCPRTAPTVAGVTAIDTAEIHDGLWRVDVAAGEVVAITHVRTRLVQVGSGRGAQPPDPPPPPGESTLTGGTITVYAFDLGYSDPPAGEVTAGRSRLRLDNRGLLPHTLSSEALGIRLETEGGAAVLAGVDLPPGDHVLYCEVPGHRAAGMEFRLTVTG